MKYKLLFLKLLLTQYSNLRGGMWGVHEDSATILFYSILIGLILIVFIVSELHNLRECSFFWKSQSTICGHSNDEITTLYDNIVSEKHNVMEWVPRVQYRAPISNSSFSHNLKTMYAHTELLYSHIRLVADKKLNDG